jgi:hypothetical protein
MPDDDLDGGALGIGEVEHPLKLIEMPNPVSNLPLPVVPLFVGCGREKGAAKCTRSGIGGGS